MPPLDTTDTAHKNAAAGSTALQGEAALHLSARPKRRTLEALEISDDGIYKVRTGDNLSTIAKRLLSMRHESSDDANLVANEVNRIVKANVDNPKFHSLKNDSRKMIREGWELKVWDKTLGPTDASCKWQDWQEAEDKPGAITLVDKCQRVLAPAGSTVVIQRGAEGIINSGATAAVAPGGSVEAALPGSFVLAFPGSEVHAYGGKVHAVDATAKVVEHDPSSLELLANSSSFKTQLALTRIEPPSVKGSETASSKLDNTVGEKSDLGKATLSTILDLQTSNGKNDPDTLINSDTRMLNTDALLNSIAKPYGDLEIYGQ
jgi:hypothetical protein